MKSKLHSADQLVFESDWLASNPFFYNDISGFGSENVNDVISSSPTVEFHAEGFVNYLQCGFSVLGQTPIKNVKFLPPCTKLYKNINNELSFADTSKETLHKWFDFRLSENDTIDLIRSRVQEWEASLPSDQYIVLPLSGGYDSRLLLWCLRDKSRVRAFTYGISRNQARSIETVYAKALAKHFNIEWKHILIGDYHNYIPQWYEEFGISTHAHGMYHIEFYQKIREQIGGTHAFLSGIIGDIWAGSLNQKTITNSNCLQVLCHNHSINASSIHLKLVSDSNLKNRFWTDNRDALSDIRYQTIAAMRLKIILLSYLMRIPQRFVFNSWSPFLDIDIAMAMLNLPSQRRFKRIWQTDFFVKEGLDLENQHLRGSSYNSLNRTALKNISLSPLDERILSSVFDSEYVRFINKHVRSTGFNRAKARLLSTRKLGKCLRLMGIKDLNIEAYYAYLCLKPVEMLLLRGAI